MKGLGRRQKGDRYLSYAKIAFALARMPCTVYHIYRITKLHRTRVLPRRLDELSAQKIVIKHKHSYPAAVLNSEIIARKKERKVEYTYTYYLLNWSHPKAKELFYYYRDYHSNIYREIKLIEKNSKEAPEIEELLRSASLKCNEGESDQDFKKRQERIEELTKKAEQSYQEILTHSEVVEKCIDQKIKLSVDLANVYKEIAKESSNSGKLDVYKEQPLKVRFAPLNVFIDFKVGRMIQDHRDMYIEMWEIMEKIGLLVIPV